MLAAASKVLAQVFPRKKPAVQGCPMGLLEAFRKAEVFSPGVVAGDGGEEAFSRDDGVGEIGGQNSGVNRDRDGLAGSHCEEDQEGRERRGHGAYSDVDWMHRQLLASFLLLLSAACGKQAVAPAGLKFETRARDLGTLTSGEEVEVRFPFVVKAPIRIDRLDGSCGCLHPRVELLDGDAFRAGMPLQAGTRGVIAVGFATAGLIGEKSTTLDIVGEGPGLPARLEIQAEMEPWFLVESGPLRFGEISGDEEEVRVVRVTGPEPFRLVRILAGGPPLKIEGIPSDKPTREQEFRVVLPPTREEGRHRRALRFLADNGFSLILQVEYIVAGELWTRPGERLLLGGIPSDAPTHASVEVGVREGGLEIPKVRLEGIPGATTDCVTLRQDSRYRVLLTLPSGLPKGPLVGTLELELLPRGESQSDVVHRKIQIIGVVL